MGMRVQYVSFVPTAVSLLLFDLMHPGARAERLGGAGAGPCACTRCVWKRLRT